MDLRDLIARVGALADPERRAGAEHALAAALGADEMLLLVVDRDIGALLPVPGARRATLPGGPEWRALLERCRSPGVHRSRLPWQGASTAAVACCADGICGLLLGGDVSDADAAALGDTLPLLGAALSAEHALVVARGELAAARYELSQSSALTQSLDKARREVDATLRQLDAQARMLEDASRRARQAARAKDEFLAMLGHELRNPLAPIFTVLQLLRQRGEWSAEHDIMARQAEHMLRLVDDLLDVSRIASGKLSLRLEPVALDGVASLAVESVGPLVQQGRHPLSVHVPHGLHVQGDARRLVQVLTNLLTNAVKYSDPGTAISLVAHRDGDAVEIEVLDRGIGIEPGKLDSIFEFFEQQQRGIDRAGGGLGLGLAIVRNVVQLHGGSVQAENRDDGPGSRFRIRLPLVEAASTVDAESPSAPSVRKARGRILVVDDNVDAARTLAMLLEMAGYEVRVAHDGVAAVDMAREFEPGAAILDIGLPGMDGYELARLLRRQSARMHLVALTGYGQPGDRREALQAGFAAHFVKPVDLDALRDELDARMTAEPGRRRVVVAQTAEPRALN